MPILSTPKALPDRGNGLFHLRLGGVGDKGGLMKIPLSPSPCPPPLPPFHAILAVKKSDSCSVGLL